MLLTTGISPMSHHVGIFKAVELCCEAGFRSLDIDFCNVKIPLLCEDNKSAITEMKSRLAYYGAIAHQAHAPFPIGKDAYRVPEENVDELLRRTLEVSGELGVSQVIFHPLRAYGTTPEQRIEINRAALAPYGEYAKKCGVNIAVENLFCQHKENRKKLTANACSTGAELAATVDALGEGFVACLDVGHSGLAGQSAAEMIRILGKKRLHALHVHDNDYFSDLHLPPYFGEMDWESIIEALAEIGYNDSFTFEIVGKPMTSLPDSLIPSALRFIYDIGMDFVRKIEERKRALGTL